MSVLGRVYCSIKARKYINLYKRVQHSGETAESLNVWESKTVLVSRLFPYILKVFGGVCLVLDLKQSVVPYTKSKKKLYLGKL